MVSAVGDENDTIRLYPMKDGDIVGSAPLVSIRQDGTICEDIAVGG